ncbi:MAG: O-antigen ligase family protein, partial [Patescibacteria group bacterium]
ATGLYSDFTSISLYLSDIFLFIAFIFSLWSNSWNLKLWLKNRQILILIIWLILGILWHYQSISGLNIWYFVKFIGSMVVSYGTAKLVTSGQSLVARKLFLSIFVCLGTLQSVIGLTQFINQSPIGLNAIGEQIIGPSVWGVAKIACPVACQFIGSATGVSGGTIYIRAYGTFPHPNLLSAFLVTTIFINIYLLSIRDHLKTKVSPGSLISKIYNQISNYWLNLALFINILGLTATFSRGAFLALGIGLITYFGLVIAIRQQAEKQSNPKTDRHGAFTGLAMTIGKVILAIIFAFLIFKPFLLTRATVSDQATIERGIYNKTALNMINDKPFFGLGIGESVFHMKQFSPVPLNAWQVQPIHNFFLLAGAELGIPGLLILIWIFFYHMKKIVSSINYQVLSGDKNLATYYMLLATILGSFLVLMLFDHYFYTLQQTQLLLWMVLGLIAVEIKNPQREDL